MYSYYKDIKKYRPTMRIQAFIEYRESQGGKLTPAQEAKRKAVIRDWWKMILWYVRLRRASKHGIYHTSLLEAERLSGPCKKITDPV